MGFWARLGLSGPGFFIFVALAALLLIGGYFFTTQSPDQQPTEVVQEVTEPTNEEASGDVEALEETEEVADATETEEALEETSPEVVEAPQAIAAPVFDLVRVEPNGAAVISGKATARNIVALMLNDEEIFKAEADAGGNFVALLDLPANEEPSSLTAQTVMPDGTRGDMSAIVLVAPISGPATEALAALDTDSGTDTDPGTDTGTEEIAQAEETKTPSADTATESGAEVASDTNQAVAEEGASEEVATAEVTPTEGVEGEGETDQPATSAENTTSEEVAEETETASSTSQTTETDTQTAQSDQNTTTEIASETEASGTEAPKTQQAEVQETNSTTTPEVTQSTGGDIEIAAADTEETNIPSVVVVDDGAVSLLQPTPLPEAPGPSRVPNIVIDTISYDDQGEVALAGRGSESSFVRVYLDDSPIKTSEIAADGNWSAELPEIDPGVYRLRVDELDAEGNVISRAETPFLREEINVVTTTAKAVTVQPGFTLWAIAQRKYGEGIQYVKVFEANKGQIRDPDLIFPGQIFSLPDQ